VLLALLIAWSPKLATVASADGPVQITVKITDNGFEPNSFTVEQGQSVELTFVWAQVAHPDDEHIITIDAYKLQSDKISSAHTQATVKFVASNTGTFTFKCDIDCDLHSSLQHGQIIVKPSAGGAAAASLQPTKLSVEPGAVVAGGADLVVSAFLLDSSGQPIPKAEVMLMSNEQFVGKTGLVEVAMGKTDQAGLVKFDYTPTHVGAQSLVLRFDGMGIYDKTEQAVTSPSEPAFGPLVVGTGTDNLHGIKGLARIAFLLVILGVWSAFGFILYQAWSVRRGNDGGNA
jgi:plastocyanin